MKLYKTSLEFKFTQTALVWQWW